MSPAISRLLAMLSVCLLVLAPAALHAREAVTPLEWTLEHTDAPGDLDGNLVADTIDALAPGTLVDASVELNRCAKPADLAVLAGYGSVDYVGRYMSFVHLSGLDAADAVNLAGEPFVAFVGEHVAPTPELAVSNRAVRVRTSPDYGAQTIEVAYPTLDGDTINIAIVDTGVDDHLHEAFLNLPLRYVAGYNSFLDLTLNPVDTGNHGTAVADVALGASVMGGDDVGMAPRAGLIDIMAQPYAERALEKLIEKKDVWNPRVVNISLGDCYASDGTDPWSQLANRAVAEGMVVVASNGNAITCGLSQGTQFIHPPSAADDVIAVTHMDDQETVDRSDDQIGQEYLVGPRDSDLDQDTYDEEKPDIAAPGIGINAADAGTTTSMSQWNGSSLAAPHVAGCAALLLQANPNMTPKAVKDLLLGTAEQFGAGDWNPTFGHGLLDCYAARAAMNTTPTDLLFEVNVLSPGEPARWESPDLRPLNEDIVAGVPNTIRARIINQGAVAGDFRVDIGIYEFSNSDQDHHICTQFVPAGLAPGAEVILECDYTPEISGTGEVHACLKAEIVYPFDVNSDNNRAQHNVLIRPTGSPATFQLKVVNPLEVDVTIDIRPTLSAACPEDLNGDGVVNAADLSIFSGLFGHVCGADWVWCRGDFDGDLVVGALDQAILNTAFGTSCPADWTFSSSMDNFVLAADACPESVELTLDPGASEAPRAVARVEVVGILAGGGEVSLGGVTVIGEKAAPVPMLRPGLLALSLVGVVLVHSVSARRRRARTRG